MYFSRPKKSASTGTTEETSCRVSSETGDPCPRPATTEIWGVPFCEPCAQRQEAYFAVGELTEGPSTQRKDERLAGLLFRLRRPGRARRGPGRVLEPHSKEILAG